MNLNIHSKAPQTLEPGINTSAEQDAIHSPVRSRTPRCVLSTETFERCKSEQACLLSQFYWIQPLTQTMDWIKHSISAQNKGSSLTPRREKALITAATVTRMGTIEAPRLQRIAQRQLSKHPTDLSKQHSSVFPPAASALQRRPLVCAAALSGSVSELGQGGSWSCAAPRLAFPKTLLGCQVDLKFRRYGYQYAWGGSNTAEERLDAVDGRWRLSGGWQM